MPVPLNNNNNVEYPTNGFEEVRSRVRQPDLRRRTLTSGSGRVAEEVSDNELRAQVLYKLEQFEECFSVYRDIIR